MTLITDYCHVCHERRPCVCDGVTPFPPLPTPEEQALLNRSVSEYDMATQRYDVRVVAPPENVVSLTRERFKRDTNPNNHAPLAALEQALGAMDEMQDGKRVTHCIVLFAIETDDGLCGTRFIQAGSADHHGQMGLIAEAQCLLREAE